MGKPWTVIGLAFLLGFQGKEQAEKRLQAHLLRVVDGDTLQVQLGERITTVRYAAISAPERTTLLGKKALHLAEQQLEKQEEVWLEAEQAEEGLLRDSQGRILAYVWSDAKGGTLLQEVLVREGLAALDPRNLKDTTPSTTFELRYIERLLRAQEQAALERKGWWGDQGPFPKASVVIFWVRYWGEEEVWLLNRGQEPWRPQEGWVIKDSGRPGNRIPLMLESQDAILPEEKVCVHTGLYLKELVGKRERQDGIVHLWARRRQIWNNDGDEAFLFDAKGSLVHRWAYPDPMKE